MATAAIGAVHSSLLNFSSPSQLLAVLPRHSSRDNVDVVDLAAPVA